MAWILIILTWTIFSSFALLIEASQFSRQTRSFLKPDSLIGISRVGRCKPLIYLTHTQMFFKSCTLIGCIFSLAQSPAVARLRAAFDCSLHVWSLSLAGQPAFSLVSTSVSSVRQRSLEGLGLAGSNEGLWSCDKDDEGRSGLSSSSTLMLIDCESEGGGAAVLSTKLSLSCRSEHPARRLKNCKNVRRQRCAGPDGLETERLDLARCFISQCRTDIGNEDFETVVI